ncbi:NusG domain II-containing protein [bacterium]|nr:NusG domain II-containing protein [bacterium]
MLKKLKIGDFIIAISVLFLGFLPLIARHSSTAESFSIYLDGKKISRLSAGKDTTFSLDARLGKVIIEINDGRARVIESSCPEKICVRTGFIGKVGQSVACVPNKLLIVAEGKEKREKFDGILE